MRRTLRDLADARKELIEIQQEFVRLQKSIDAVRDCVTDSLTRFFCSERPAITALAEENSSRSLLAELLPGFPLRRSLRHKGKTGTSGKRKQPRSSA